MGLWIYVLTPWYYASALVSKYARRKLLHKASAPSTGSDTKESHSIPIPSQRDQEQTLPGDNTKLAEGHPPPPSRRWGLEWDSSHTGFWDVDNENRASSKLPMDMLYGQEINLAYFKMVTLEFCLLLLFFHSITAYLDWNLREERTWRRWGPKGNGKPVHMNSCRPLASAGYLPFMLITQGKLWKGSRQKRKIIWFMF